MDKLRFGVLGCADIAKRYMINAINAVENCEVVAVASRSEDKAKDFAENFGVEYVVGYDAMLERTDINAIYIPLPIGLHKEWCIRSAKKGLHIICEKSLAPNFDEVSEIVEVCKANNVALFENFMCDYHPQHQKVLELIQDDEVGEIRHIDAKFGFPLLAEGNIRYSKNLGGGALNDAGAYTAFMANKLQRSLPSVISCSLCNLGWEVDMMGAALFKYAGGVTASLVFGFSHDYHNEYTVWGSKGTINLKRAFSIPPDLDPQLTLIKNGKKECFNLKSANHFELLVSDFYKVAFHEKECPYSKIIDQANVLNEMRRKVTNEG